MKSQWCSLSQLTVLIVLSGLSVSYAGLTNIAPTYGIASADAYWSERPPYLAIDGVITGLSHWSAGSHATPSNPHWLVVDLQNAYPVGQITVFGLPWAEGDPFLGFTNDYNLYTSMNGTDWTLIGSGSWAEDTDPAVYSDTFVLAGNPLLRYAKYEVVGGTHWADLAELAILAETPVVPAPGAMLLASVGAGLTAWLRRRRIV